MTGELPAARRLAVLRVAVVAVEPLGEWAEWPLEMMQREGASFLQEADARLVADIYRAHSQLERRLASDKLDDVRAGDPLEIQDSMTGKWHTVTFVAWAEHPFVDERAVAELRDDRGVTVTAGRSCLRRPAPAPSAATYPRMSDGGLPRVRLSCHWRPDTVLPTPDVARWQSYGWRVVSVDEGVEVTGRVHVAGGDGTLCGIDSGECVRVTDAVFSNCGACLFRLADLR